MAGGIVSAPSPKRLHLGDFPLVVRTRRPPATPAEVEVDVTPARLVKSLQVGVFREGDTTRRSARPF